MYPAALGLCLQLGDPALEHGEHVGAGGVRPLVLRELPDLHDVEVAQPGAERRSTDSSS